MSRLYEALRRAESKNGERIHPAVESGPPVEMLKNILDVEPEAQTKSNRSIPWNVSPASRLVALSEPKSLGAEKFRALAARLGHIRSQRELKSLIVTSTVICEGKSLVAANLAVTLARYAKGNVLLIEGDLRRPALTSMFVHRRLDGLGDWWTKPGDELGQFTYQLNEMSLWFLSAGAACDDPCQLLQSERFAAAMDSMASQYDWIIIDSTPISPVVDANLWSRLVDGSILVVREKITPVQALKKGLESLDGPKLIGIVLNDAAEPSHDYSNYSYYSK